ncbi:terpene cyclase/mutase family protein [Streptomyces sp. NBC_01433]|uniref:prenyltransferase/squalene oxidase repeat-containing protein n=1 Tax=Streptomyces sp. NBC_01433 TaxID=2903864 RepID=UPI00224EAC7D|nr:prenyltransferase/squalene oxidase repeat-containing protein [Streptomyces sp. NBC_01433]MCX4677522.1 terpene cyclase/mutase family protein [Streptomyces sp. NBC_01433]
MTVRRSVSALVTTAVLLAAAAPAAVAAPSPSPSAKADLPPGLYGTGDPTYDGVWRQSLAFLAQKVEYVTPATQSVEWLVGQQCDSGAFPAYRDAGKPCDASTVMDTNATAAAVQALVELAVHREAVDNGVTWLKSVQNEDGGWGYNAGSPSDANSTAVVIGALARAGLLLGDVTTDGGRTPYAALQSFAIPCGGKDGGAFAYQPGKDGKLTANADATAAGVLGAMGKGLAVGNSNAVKDPVCTKGTGLTPEQTAQNGAHYLAGALGASPHLNLPPMPGADDTAPKPDFGNTADAVAALAASGHKDKAAASVQWLEKNAKSWAREGGPAATAQLILAAHATGTDARDFGGVDLVKQLNATGPAPAATAAPSPTASGQQPKGDTSSDDGALGVWWLVGIGLVVGVGIGFLISRRGKNARL